VYLLKAIFHLRLFHGQIARDDLFQVEGVVIRVRAAGYFLVRPDSGWEISAKLSDRMRNFNIPVILGDRVTVGVSP